MRRITALLLTLTIAGCIQGPVYQREDLPGIVLRTSEGPPGTALNRRGPESVNDLAPYFGELERAGFVAAHGANLGHEDVLSEEAEPGSLSPNEARGVQSTVLLFETAEGADAVLDGQRRGAEDGPFRVEAWLSADGLGEEGFGLRARSPSGLTATLYEWRRGNLLLFLNVVGRFEVSEVHSLAQIMDRRAVEALRA